jgi:hypothetical protein
MIPDAARLMIMMRLTRLRAGTEAVMAVKAVAPVQVIAEAVAEAVEEERLILRLLALFFPAEHIREVKFIY